MLIIDCFSLKENSIKDCNQKYYSYVLKNMLIKNRDTFLLTVLEEQLGILNDFCSKKCALSFLLGHK